VLALRRVAGDYRIDLTIAICVLLAYEFDGQAGGGQENADVVAVAIFRQALDPRADPASVADGDGIHGEGVGVAGADQHDFACVQRHVDGDTEGPAEVAIGEA
jgi:hypothetical protein